MHPRCGKCVPSRIHRDHGHEHPGLTPALTAAWTRSAQYMNVVLAAEMSLVDKPHLEAVQNAAPAPAGTPSDLLDGLLVAQDLLWKTLPQDGKPDKHERRIILARAWLRRCTVHIRGLRGHVLEASVVHCLLCIRAWLGCRVPRPLQWTGHTVRMQQHLMREHAALVALQHQHQHACTDE